MDDPQLPLSHPANASLLAWLEHRRGTQPGAVITTRSMSCPPDDAGASRNHTGSHPDVVSYLWDTLDAELPERCGWVVHGTPVLAHPHTGVIFAFANGTIYALRLAKGDIHDALAAGADQVFEFPSYPELDVEASTMDLLSIGPEWIVGGWRREEPRWCQAAFQAAAGGWLGGA